MSTIEELCRQRDLLPEYCQSVIKPKVDEFNVAFKMDYSSLFAVLRQWGPVVVAGWLLPVIFSKMSSGLLKSSIGWVGLAAIIVGGYFIAIELRKTFRHASARHKRHRELSHWIKQNVLRFLDPNMKWSQTVPFPLATYKNCGLFDAKYDRASAQDHCIGFISKTHFELYEIATYILVKHKDSQGKTQTRYEPVFRGLLFQADFNKNFPGHTVVKTDRAEKKFGFLARGVQRFMSRGSELKLVELENPNFEQYFKVLSTDAIEARYILTPTFMEKIMDLRSIYGDLVQVAFMNNKMVVVIPHEKDFLGMSYNLNDITKTAVGWADELIYVLAIVEELELNSRIWNKTSQPVGA